MKSKNLAKPDLEVLPLKWRIVIQPGLISLGLYISVFQDRPNRGDFYIFKNMFENNKKVENAMCPINVIS